MAKIVDPDALAVNVNGTPTTEEVAIDTDAKTIELRIAGDLDDNNPGSTSGVTLQCLYSFLKEEWKTDSTLNKFKFPLKALYEAKFIWQYGWQPANAQTRDLIRDAGWQEIDGSEYACIISLGSQYDDTQQAYYQQVTGFDQSTTNFDKTGPLDEAIEIYDGGSGDYRDYLKLYLREWQRTYADYNVIVEQGFSALTYIAYRAPLANADDIKNTGTTQAYVDGANEPYLHMDLQFYSGTEFAPAVAKAYTLSEVGQDGAGRWFRCSVAGTLDAAGVADYTANGGTGTFVSYPGERQIGSNYYAFNRAVQYSGLGALPDADEIYKFCQNELTKASNVNTDADGDGYGVVNGNVAVRLAYYVGDTLHSWPGVNFDDFDSNITNDIVLHDITVGSGAQYGLDSEDVPNTSSERTYPFTAAGNMVFSSNLVNETNADTRYVMYFKNIAEHERTDFSITGASGATATLETSAGSLTIGSGEYFRIAGFQTNDENNGVKLAGGVPTATSVFYYDALGVTQVNESAGDTVTVEEQPFDTASAIIVDDNGGTDIDGQVTTTNIAFDFNYDNNVQGGRTQGTDADVVVVAQGLNASEWVFGEFTITRTTGLNFPVNAPDERTYLNP